MELNKIKLIANATEYGCFCPNDFDSLDKNFEDAFDALKQLAEDNDYNGFETVDAEFSINHSHLHAEAADGTEYDADGEFFDSHTKDGELIADFIDKTGHIVFIKFHREG